MGYCERTQHFRNACIYHRTNGVGEAPTQLFPLESANLNDCILSEDQMRTKSKKFSNLVKKKYIERERERESCS